MTRGRIKVCFSSDIIFCGWLGSKYQLNVYNDTSDTRNWVHNQEEGGIYNYCNSCKHIQLLKFLHTGFVLFRSNFTNTGLLQQDGFARLVAPPGHVIVTSFAYFGINCYYGQLVVYSARRTARSINTEKKILCHSWGGNSREVSSTDPTVYGTDVVELYLCYFTTYWWE